MRFTLDKKLLVVIMAVVLLIGVMATGIVYYLANIFSEREAHLYLDHFKNSVATDRKTLEVALTSVMQNPEFSSAIYTAYYNKDNKSRDKLYTLTARYFEEQLKKTYNISYLTFYNTDSTVLLRVHDHKYYGDKVDEVTLKNAIASQKMEGGLEPGPKNFALRVVSPVIAYNGKVIGYVEVSEETDKLLEDFNAKTKADITFVINTKVAEKNKISFQELYKSNALVYFSTNQKDVKNMLDTVQYSITDQANYAFKPLIKVNGNRFYLREKFNDASQQPIGDVIITGNANQLADQLKYIVYAIVILAVLAIIVAFFFSRILTRPATELLNLMSKAERGDLTVRGRSKSDDEFGQLTKSFNQLVSHQAEIVGSIRAASETVACSAEEMVASGEQVTASAGNVATNIQQVAEDTVRGNQSIIKATTALQQLADIVRKSKDQAEHAADATHSTLEAASNGQSTVTQTVSRMLNIKRKSLESEGVLATLNKHTQQIDKITQTITGLASQTNLLALNAAIEAARAGASGKGFAVVAEEVRKLAEQSDREASDASNLLSKINESANAVITASQESRDEVEAGVATVTDAGKALEAIVSEANRTVRDVNAIVDIANQTVVISDAIVRLVDSVATVLENTAENAQGVSRVTKETTTAMQTVAASAEELSSMAIKLQSMVEQFKITK